MPNGFVTAGLLTNGIFLKGSSATSRILPHWFVQRDSANAHGNETIVGINSKIWVRPKMRDLSPNCGNFDGEEVMNHGI